jgi:glycosyltransferase involved in cell wall biosynthesis
MKTDTFEQIDFVSILMPAYNAEKYIKFSIESIITQDHKFWELIIINDASSDSTDSIIKQYINVDNRIKVFNNDENKGLGYSINLALNKSIYNIIARLDADDIVTNDWLSSRLKFLKNNPDHVCVSGSRIIINQKGEKLYKIHDGLTPIQIKWKLIFGNPIIHPGIVFKKIDNLNYDPNLNYLEDWDLWTKYNAKGEISILNDFKVLYRVHSNNISRLHGNNDSLLLPTIEKIFNFHTEKLKINVNVIEKSILWIIYRNRSKLIISQLEIKKGLNLVLKIHERFINTYINNKKDLEDINYNLWDEIFHLNKSCNLKTSYIINLFKRYPIKLFRNNFSKNKLYIKIKFFNILVKTLLNV